MGKNGEINTVYNIGLIKEVPYPLNSSKARHQYGDVVNETSNDRIPQRAFDVNGENETSDNLNVDTRHRIGRDVLNESVSGRNLQTDIMNFSAGLGIRNKRSNVIKMIQQAYVLFDLGRTQEAEIRLIEAGEEYACLCTFITSEKH